MAFLFAVLALFVVWASGDDDGAVAIGGAAPRTSRKQQSYGSARWTKVSDVKSKRCSAISALCLVSRRTLSAATMVPTRADPAERGKGAGAREHVWRLGVERQPPDEQLPRRIDFQPDSIDPRRPECGLMSKHGGGPLRRCPQAHHDRQGGDAKLQSVSSERHHWLLPSWRVQHR